MLREAYPRVRFHRTPRPREPLLGELWVGQGLCVGLDVGVVKRVHTLLGGVHRLATALKVVEEVQEEVREIKDE